MTIQFIIEQSGPWPEHTPGTLSPESQRTFLGSPPKLRNSASSWWRRISQSPSSESKGTPHICGSEPTIYHLPFPHVLESASSVDPTPGHFFLLPGFTGCSCLCSAPSPSPAFQQTWDAWLLLLSARLGACGTPILAFSSLVSTHETESAGGTRSHVGE